MSELLQLKDITTGRDEWLDEKSGDVYSDKEGGTLLRRMDPIDCILGESGKPLRDHETDSILDVADLRIEAAMHYYRHVADQYGVPVKFKAHYRGRSAKEFVAQPGFVRDAMPLFDKGGRLVAMDLGVNDVHTNATLPNYIGGYKIAEGAADLASPVILVPKASDVYYTWNKETDFQRKIPSQSANGGSVSEVNPGLSSSTYTTASRALAAFIPTEIQANADTPIRVFPKAVQMCTDGLRLEREIRVVNKFQTSANFLTSLVTTIAAGSQWDGGSASDPVANLHAALEASFMPVTEIVMSEQVFHAFIRNPAVQKFFTFKDGLPGIPSPEQVANTLGLPPIVVVLMKYMTGGSATYVWGDDVTLIRRPKESPPTSQMDVGTSYTMRWIGGEAPDGTLTAGFLVRTYFDPKRGARGGTQVVVVHNDDEQITSNAVGGLLINAYQ